MISDLDIRTWAEIQVNRFCINKKVPAWCQEISSVSSLFFIAHSNKMVQHSTPLAAESVWLQPKPLRDRWLNIESSFWRSWTRMGRSHRSDELQSKLSNAKSRERKRAGMEFWLGSKDIRYHPITATCLMLKDWKNSLAAASQKQHTGLTIPD